MGRPWRAAEGGWVYHVLNRANARLQIFDKPEDYQAFERILEQARERYDMPLLAFCLMPNHWHLLLWPKNDGDLSRFVGWLTLTHTQRWHAHRGSSGSGHLYQGRFKSFPVQEDDHFYTVCRYIERNPLRANLVRRAVDWRWSSLWRAERGDRAARALLGKWPVSRPRDWAKEVQRPQREAEEAAIRRSIQRGVPFGDSDWTEKAVNSLGLASTLRPRGRPRKQQAPQKARKGS